MRTNPPTPGDGATPDIYTILDGHGIVYQKKEHPPVFTCEDAAEHIPKDLPGIGLKNLFVRDNKGKRYILLVVPDDKRVDLKAFNTAYGVGRLSFASAEKLLHFLGVQPGSATPLGVIYDTERKVEICIDEAIIQSEFLQCHPLVNTASLCLRSADLLLFLQRLSYTPRIMNLPQLC